MKKFWKWFLARFHLSETAVCELSADRGPFDDFHDYDDGIEGLPWLSADRGPFDDFHDYDDGIEGLPWHFVLLKCKRCGKEFYI